MQEQWRRFLSERGFAIDATSGRARAPHLDPEPAGARCVDLNHFTAMRFVGPDATTFLQGYLTCDMRALSVERALFGAYCNIKGRVVADATVALIGGQPALIVAASLREPIRTSLAKYLAFARSKFDAPEAAPILLGLIDPPAELATLQPLACAAFHDGIAIALPGARARVLVALSQATASEIWREYAAREATGDATAWDLVDVRSGIAHVSAPTSEEFLPQMLDYDRIDAISFTKGCYLGQEIVARTQHRGRAKRHLQRLEWRGAPAPAIGATLQNTTGASTGTLVTVAPTAPDAGEALAVLNDTSVGDLHATGVTFAIR